MKTTILYIHPSLEVGGAEQLRRMVVRRLDRRRYEARLLCLTAKGRIGEELEREGVRVDALGCSSAIRSWRTTRRLAQHLRRHPADIVQTSLMPANWHGRLAAGTAGVARLITEEHSLDDRYDPRWRWLMRPLARRWLRKPDAVIACSEAVARAVQREDGPASRVVVLRNAVDLEELRPSGSREAVRRRLGVSSSDWLVANIANLSAVKGQRVLLEAFARLLRAVPSARLVMAGEGPQRLSLERQIARLGLAQRVSLIGIYRPIADLLQAADGCVSSSLQEGFGLTLLEAMALGVPCVATRVGGVTEFADDGDTALLVAPGDASALAGALGCLADDRELAARLAAQAKARVQQAFHAQRYVQQLDELYERLLNGCDPSR